MAKGKLQPPKSGTKLATLLDALKTDVSLDQLASALNWQHHTVRAALTRLRQRGYAINRKRDGASKTSVYRLSRVRARSR
ncbi:MAG: DUF3489 domain-containing protein [Hyphomicrobiaceae bacterium]